jgi:DNA replication protein DnaC
MSLNGYPASLIAIDDKMAALRRPPPPLMGLWLRSASKRMPPKERWDAACAQWRADLTAWEQAHPESAIRWLELREEYKHLEEAIEAAKWPKPDEYAYEKLKRQGAPPRCVDAARHPQDLPSFVAAKNWLLEPESWCLMLLGGHGTGKTTAATWAAHQNLMRGTHVKWVRCSALVDAPLFGFEAELYRQQCRAASLLVLDDIAEGTRAKDSKVFLGWLDDVLDARWGSRKRTIITGNQTPAECIEFIGQRLADRLNDGSIHDCGEGSLRGKTP